MTAPFTEHEHHFDVFGTQVRLLVGAPAGEPLTARLAALRVQRTMHDLHAKLTRFEPGSELSRLNARSGQPIAVSSTLLDAVQAAIFAAEVSEGLVDPTITPHLERAGYARSRAGEPPADLRAALETAPRRRPAARAPRSGWERLDVDPEDGTVQLPSGTRLDLGGSAKGLAVDIAARMLADRPTFAIDAGGDIRLGGTARVPRTVNIAHPLTGTDAHRCTLHDGAVATSGLRTRIWKTAAGHAHHLIDPSTGEPAWTGVIQATALARTAVEAETLAKVALLRGPHAGRRVLERHGGGALILDDGELLLVGALATTPHGLVAA
jgi:thiamine biosynthesis lipoprotein